MARPFAAAQDWVRLSPLLDEALDLPQAQRERWLDALPAESEALKPSLRRWLARHAQLPCELLRTLPKLGDAAAGHDEDLDERNAGETIGPYLLRKRIGAGGMGVVWLAERADGLITRPVALKLPRRARQAGTGMAERMARERRILATLAHPNIARLYDVGLATDGQPWLALEYVEGLRIDRHCEQRGLGLNERLGLILQAADAVAHAHGRLVVHSDLKPSNILVTDEGEVRLLDFGVAALLGDDSVVAQAVAGKATGPGLTPGYASPEQLRGEPVGVASDVYSLGVLLYELLCGVRPQSGDRGTPHPPSGVASAAWRDRLRGDLDAIVAKALRPQTELRYATVQALADDLRCFLDRRPVQARPAGPCHRGLRFAQRHARSVFASALAIAALCATTVFSVLQWQQARAERAQALEVKDFIVATLQQANPYASGSREASLPALLAEARTRLERLSGTSVATRVELLNVIGWNQASMNLVDAAEAVAVQANREARAALPATHPQRLGAELLDVVVKRHRGDFRAARVALEPLLVALRPRRAELPEDFVRALRNSSNIALHEGDAERALRDAREAVELSRAHYGERHNETLTSYSVLAMAALAAREPQEALAVARRAEALAVELFGATRPHARTIELRSTLARAYAAAGELAPAIELMQRCLADAVAMHGDSSFEAGIHHRSLARMWLDAGDAAKSRSSAEAALGILAAGGDSASSLVGDLHLLRGQAWVAEGTAAAALAAFDEALRIRVQQHGLRHARTQEAMAWRADALARLGRGDEARAQLEQLDGGVLDEPARKVAQAAAARSATWVR